MWTIELATNTSTAERTMGSQSAVRGVIGSSVVVLVCGESYLRWIQSGVRRIATVVVGAGPAGLLLSIIARLLYERRGGEPGAWPFYLFDKRATYERTHRLRMAPGPYREIAKDLQHPWFDEFLAFLEDERFRPEVNRLEERLSALALRLGVRRELLCVGPAEGGLTLAELRGRLEREGRLLTSDRLTIVGADSVHSAVRELVRR